MDHIKKLLRKISSSDRRRLIAIVEKLQKGNIRELQAKKVQGTGFYRVRSGHFRIIFHRDKKSRKYFVDSIRVRNEGTYRDF